MRATFATLGIPEMLVTDNGTAFTSTEFAQFVKQNGIQHITMSPYHPASNRLAEHAVKTFKEGMKKLTKGSLETKLLRFLFNYRSTIQSTTGVSPAELMFGRPLRLQLDLMCPNIQSNVIYHQEQRKHDHDRRAKERDFKPGDSVYVQNCAQGANWLPGVVVEARGPISYTVSLEDRRLVRRHVDHIRIRELQDETHAIPTTSNWDNTLPATPSANAESAPDPAKGDDGNRGGGTMDGSGQPLIRRSNCTCRPPERFSKRTEQYVYSN